MKPQKIKARGQNHRHRNKNKNTETKGYSKEILNFVADNSQKP